MSRQREHRQWRGRPQFMVRFAVIVALIFGFAAYGFLSLSAAIVSRSWPGPVSAALWPLLFLVILLPLIVGAMRRFGRPLNDFVAASDRVGRGDMTVRVREIGPPWLRSVAGAFNTMAARLEQQQRQRRELMADVAHELRTPLAVMQGRLEALADGVYPLDAAQVSELLEDTHTLGRLVEDLRTLAHSEGGTLSLQREPTDLAILLDEVVAALTPEARRHHGTIVLEVPGDLPPVDVDPVRFREIATNLLANAVQHSGSGSVISVRAGADDDGVAIRVHNDAVIPAAEVPRLFDRFYKGQHSRGSGLGLTIAKNLAVAHGGTIAVESAAPHGTTFVVTIPCAGPRAAMD